MTKSILKNLGLGAWKRVAMGVGSDYLVDMEHFAENMELLPYSLEASKLMLIVKREALVATVREERELINQVTILFWSQCMK